MTVGRMYRQVAHTVYGILLPESCFWTAMRCMRFAERLLKSSLWCERGGRLPPLSGCFTGTLFMRQCPTRGTPRALQTRSTNLMRSGFPPQTVQHTGESFCELFESAADLAGEKIALFRTGAPAAEITNGIQFDGGPEKNTPITPHQHTVYQRSQQSNMEHMNHCRECGTKLILKECGAEGWFLTANAAENSVSPFSAVPSARRCSTLQRIKSCSLNNIGRDFMCCWRVTSTKASAQSMHLSASVRKSPP